MSKNMNTNFRKFQSTIKRGDEMTMDGWWAAGERCKAMKLSPSAYARQAKAELGDDLYWKEGTVRVSVGTALKAMEYGWSKDMFETWTELVDGVQAVGEGNGKGGKKNADPVKDELARIEKLTTAQARKLAKLLAEKYLDLVID